MEKFLPHDWRHSLRAPISPAAPSAQAICAPQDFAADMAPDSEVLRAIGALKQQRMHAATSGHYRDAAAGEECIEQLKQEEDQRLQQVRQSFTFSCEKGASHVAQRAAVPSARAHSTCFALL